MYRLILLFFVVLAVACGPQKKLQRNYVGQPVSAIEKEFGKAKTVFEKESSTDYIFEKMEYLKSAEISQHKLTLDPMVSPQARKTTQYYVTVVDGIITKIRIEEEYERRGK